MALKITETTPTKLKDLLNEKLIKPKYMMKQQVPKSLCKRNLQYLVSNVRTNPIARPTNVVTAT
jgi:hypothetical protein